MNQLLKYLKGDRVLWILTLLMLAFSLVSVYSFVPILVNTKGGSPFGYLFKHIISVGLSFGIMFWVHRRDPKYLSMMSKFMFYVAIALLIFTMFFTTGTNDAKRWVRVPVIGLTFQSSDFARLAIILYLSRLLVKKKEYFNDWKEGFWPIMLPVIVICGLIVKDNFSTAAILFAICLTLMFLGKVPISKIATTIGGGIALFGLVILVHKATPSLNLLPRLTTWENRIFNQADNEDNVRENAQVTNAMLAIYNGRLTTENILGGQGPGDGKLKEYLPEAYADFYYSSFVEEFGPISAIILVMIYLIILFRVIRIGLKAESPFEMYVCFGIGILLTTQASVNMLVCTGVFPVTGQNMPFLAMGGSAMIMACAELGIVQAIARKQLGQEVEPITNELIDEAN